MEQFTDTSKEALQVQVNGWRRMTGEHRVLRAMQLNETARQISAAGIRNRHPEYTPEQVQLALGRLRLGEELFREVFPNVDIRP
jgi:hypothetical protein